MPIVRGAEQIACRGEMVPRQIGPTLDRRRAEMRSVGPGLEAWLSWIGGRISRIMRISRDISERSQLGSRPARGSGRSPRPAPVRAASAARPRHRCLPIILTVRSRRSVSRGLIRARVAIQGGAISGPEAGILGEPGSVRCVPGDREDDGRDGPMQGEETIPFVPLDGDQRNEPSGVGRMRRAEVRCDAGRSRTDEAPSVWSWRKATCPSLLENTLPLPTLLTEGDSR
jgi:hypothetical protein